jgi:hypothetical protein
MNKKTFSGNNPALAFINTPKEIKVTNAKINKEIKKPNNKITTKINIDTQVKSKDLIRIATYVSRGLKKTFNIIAAKEGRKLYEVINEALVRYAKEKNALK